MFNVFAPANQTTSRSNANQSRRNNWILHDVATYCNHVQLHSEIQKQQHCRPHRPHLTEISRFDRHAPVRKEALRLESCRDQRQLLQMVFGPISGKLGRLRSEPYRPSAAPVSTGAEVCQFFAKSGWCKFGDECRYQHMHGPDTVGGIPACEKSGEVCQFFAKSGWCKYGDKCKHEHIATNKESAPREPCNFFAKSGWCQYGDGCKYEHIHGPDAPSAPATFDRLNESNECCQFFAKAGWCKFSDQCKYQHVFEPTQAPREKSGEICQFFAKSGWCKFGDLCKHEHVGEARPEPGVTRETCQFFSKSGWCQYGNGCKYLHLPGLPGPSPPSRSEPVASPGTNGREICQFFSKNGWCKYSDGCNYLHLGIATNSGLDPSALSASQAEAAAGALLATKGMQKAEAIGLDLSEEAVKALLTLPSTHASELLETVAEKHETLRDPSNYVVSTIAKGYVPRAF